MLQYTVLSGKQRKVISLFCARTTESKTNKLLK